jgi:hypothetical protein
MYIALFTPASRTILVKRGQTQTSKIHMQLQDQINSIVEPTVSREIIRQLLWQAFIFTVAAVTEHTATLTLRL